MDVRKWMNLCLNLWQLRLQLFTSILRMITKTSSILHGYLHGFKMASAGSTAQQMWTGATSKESRRQMLITLVEDTKKKRYNIIVCHTMCTWRTPMQNAINAKFTHVRFSAGKLLFTLACTSWQNFTSQNEIHCSQNPFQSLGNTKRHKCHSLRGLSWKFDKMDVSGFALKPFICRCALWGRERGSEKGYALYACVWYCRQLYM